MAAAFAAAPVLTSVLIASTIATVAFTVISTRQQAKAARRQREAEKQKEKQLAVQGLQESNEIIQQQLDALAAATVASAGSGIDPFTGSPLSTQQKIENRAEKQLRTSALNNVFDIAASKSRQNQLKLQGRAAVLSGIASATSSISGASSSIGGLSPKPSAKAA